MIKQRRRVSYRIVSYNAVREFGPTHAAPLSDRTVSINQASSLLHTQEAQLSQRDRAMFGVIKYFASHPRSFEMAFLRKA